MLKTLLRDLKSGRVGRREANRLLARAGLGLAALPLVGLPGGRPARAAGENDILYFTWEGYEIPELHPAYMAKYGASPPTSIFAGEEDALAKLRAGFEATLSHPCTYSLARWREAGVIQPIDVGRLRNYGDLFDGLKTIPGSVVEGQTFFVPFDWGNSSVVYRTDVVGDGAEESWNMLFDERWKGRIGMSNDAEACVEVAALALGYKNIFTLDDAQLAEVKKMLIKQRDLLRFYWDSSTTLEQAMAAGEVVAAYAWNSSYLNLKNQGVPVAYARPKEGIFTWCCGLVLLDPAVGNLEAAYDLIDAMLEPEVGKYMIEAYSYGHSNRKAYELADPAAVDALGMQDPAELFTSGIFFQPVPEPFSLKYVELFTDLQAL